MVPFRLHLKISPILIYNATWPNIITETSIGRFHDAPISQMPFSGPHEGICLYQVRVHNHLHNIKCTLQFWS